MKKTGFSSWQCKLFMVAALSAFSMFSSQLMPGTGYGVAYAQQNTTVKGIVKDANGEPVIGASVVVKGSSLGTVTDIDGKFELTAKTNQVLVISYIGYSTQEVKATANVNVMLQEDAAALDEVVVLGYGVAQKKQDLSASVGVVSDPQRLAVRPVTTTEAMLQGQLPGVTVTADGGDPTATPSIVIRGKGSHRDALLWVVDGIPGAPIPSLYDIESLVVLKDAASAAIYGASSGAGGVILVTTKQAKKTNGAQITYEGTVGVRNSVNLIHGLDAQEQIRMREISYGAANMGNWIPENASQDFKNYIGTTRTDWTDAIFRSAGYQRHNVTLAAGNDASQHRLSFAYDNDQGTLVNTYKKNMNLRYNGNYNINKYVNISENLTWSNGTSRSVDYTSAYTGTVLSAIYMPQSASVYDEDGTFGGTIAEEYAQYSAIHGDAVNPMRMLKANNLFDRTSNVWTTTNLTVHDIIPGLKFISRFTYRLQNSYYKNFSPIRDEIGKPNLDNSLNESSNRWTEWKTENTLTYDNSFGKHNISALLATTADQSSGHRMYMTGNNFGDESDYLQYFAFAGSLSSYGDSPNGNDIADSNVAFISRVGYSYDDRYFFTASFRRDWAGRLPKGHQAGNFPGVTAAWKISNESFFEPLKSTINLLKFRGSWGRMGNINSIDRGYKNSVLGTTVWNEQAFYGAELGTMYGTFIYNDRALNPFLSWETSE
ncbi:MAG: SusC/RagA family TonB-linked outer membrane protein, partial [Prevotellaceae bacterium]|nr:SusC/RagA family TonB-linked outer membrane protein [Prevotellaceae bacterium]